MNYGFERREVNGLVYYTAPMIESAGAFNMFTTRLGGVSRGIYQSLNFRRAEGETEDNIHENYRRALAVGGRTPESVVCTKQVHGNIVTEAVLQDAGRGFSRAAGWQTDGLITRESGITLAGYYADCLPIVLFDKRNRTAGIIHCGWRGTSLDICGEAVRKMESLYGTRPENVLAALGPAVCAQCFETDSDVPDAMTAQYGKAVEKYIVKRQNKWFVDIAGINLFCLEKSGVNDSNITVSNICTKCSQSGEFWSHRATNGVRGVHAAFVGIK